VRTLALTLLAAAVPASAATLPALPRSFLSFGAPMASETPQVAGRPVCEQKPLVAKTALPEPRAYFRSLEVFQTDGLTVRVAGSKDRDQKYGFFLAFSVDGDAEPVWVKGSLGKKHFALRGKPYSVETKLSILHHERIRLVVRREADDAVVADFTTGELAERVQAVGSAMTLLGREYRATYVEDIRESDGRTQILADQHTVLLTTYDTYSYDGGKTGYKFSQLPLQAEKISGASVFARAMNAKAPGPRGDVPVVYGFHLNARGELCVYDLTDYRKDGVPACSPLD
jgi:hypothetical protein